MRKTLMPVALVLSLTVNLSAIGALLYHRWNGAENATERMTRARRHFLQTELGLTRKQLTESESLREAFVKQVTPLRRQVREKNAQLVRLLTEGDRSKARTDALLNDISSLQRCLQFLAVVHLRHQAKLLQPRQRAKFFHFLAEGVCPVEGHPMGGSSLGLGGGQCPERK